MKRLFFVAVLLVCPFVSRAGMVVTPWQSLFKGIDHAVGTNFPDTTIPRLQVVHCVRVALNDPNVQLFTTPRASNYLAEATETRTLTISNFLKSYKLAVAVDANFYDAHPGGSDPTSEGL